MKFLPWLTLLLFFSITGCKKDSQTSPEITPKTDDTSTKDLPLTKEEVEEILEEDEVAMSFPAGLPNYPVIGPELLGAPGFIPGGGGGKGRGRDRDDDDDDDDDGETPPEAPPTPAVEGNLRLMTEDVETTATGEGRLEIFHAGNWGSICNRQFDEKAARVACRHIKRKNRARPASDEAVEVPFEVVEEVPIGYALHTGYGQAKGPINMAQVRCDGSEERITDCVFGEDGNNEFGAAQCKHFQDVALTCKERTRDVCQRKVSATSSECRVPNNNADCPGGSICKEISDKTEKGCCIPSNETLCASSDVPTTGTCDSDSMAFPFNCGMGEICISMNVADFGCCVTVDTACTLAANQGTQSEFCVPMVDTCPAGQSCLEFNSPATGCCLTNQGICGALTNNLSNETCENSTQCSNGDSCFDLGTPEGCCLTNNEFCQYRNAAAPIPTIELNEEITDEITTKSEDNFDRQGVPLCESDDGNDKMYRFVAPATDLYSVRAASEDFNVVLKIFDESCIDGTEQCVTGSTLKILKNGMPFVAELFENLNQGEELFIVVDAIDENAVGEFTLIVETPVKK